MFCSGSYQLNIMLLCSWFFFLYLFSTWKRIKYLTFTSNAITGRHSHTQTTQICPTLIQSTSLGSRDMSVLWPRGIRTSSIIGSNVRNFYVIWTSPGRREWYKMNRKRTYCGRPKYVENTATSGCPKFVEFISYFYCSKNRSLP